MSLFYKYSAAALCAAVMTVGFVACSDDDKGEPELESKYLSIEGATYRSGDQPEGNGALDGVQCNDRALAGGMNFISISSDEEYDMFYVSVEGVDGYLEYAPVAEDDTRAGHAYTYLIPIMYSSELGSNITMVVSARNMAGAYTASVRKSIQFVESMEGDLAINLTFENEKDIDLHLYCPNGMHIYFGNRGGEVYDANGNYLGEFGLDHDSNPACSIDALNNENIVIPEAFVMNGEYKVVVNMYENCNRYISTDWFIVTRYKGNIIPTLSGKNPMRGTYPAGAPDDEFTEVMTFRISDAHGELPEYYGTRSADSYETLLGIGLGTDGDFRLGGNACSIKGTGLNRGEEAKVRNYINKIAD